MFHRPPLGAPFERPRKPSMAYRWRLAVRHGKHARCSSSASSGLMNGNVDWVWLDIFEKKGKKGEILMVNF